MFEINKIYNMDCLDLMKEIPNNFVDLVITSPPYNTCVKRKGGPTDIGKYDEYKDNKSEEEYINWTIEVFNGYNKIVKENRVVLYNFGYSIENSSLPYTLVSGIVNNTDWQVVDTILWKKSNAMPHPASYNRLNRVYEFIWVFARKKEVKTFKMFKKVSSISEKTGQKYYEIVDNLIQAKNNDGTNELNKATFSTDLVTKLIDMYGQEGDLVYDNFSGTGTTALGAIEKNCNFICSEISSKQCELANERIREKLNSHTTTSCGTNIL
jgi:DNA modification methylase